MICEHCNEYFTKEESEECNDDNDYNLILSDDELLCPHCMNITNIFYHPNEIAIEMLLKSK